MRDRPLVEPVDLELEPVVAEVEDQVPLQEPCGRVPDAPPAEVRVDGEPLQELDPAAAVPQLEAEHAGPLPFTAILRVDHEPAELLGLGERTVGLVEQVAAVARPRAREKRLDLFVCQQLREEVDILPFRATQPDAVRLDHGTAPSTARRRTPVTPESSATPSRISARPPSADQRSGSPRIV